MSRFIVFEGIDGSGKTTQAKLFAERLRKDGRSVLETREPTNGVVGKLIRSMLTKQHANWDYDWKAMSLLFSADRAAHVSNVILPMLAAGADVVCDRYILSTVAYQVTAAVQKEYGPPRGGGYDRAAREFFVDWMRDVCRMFPKPDLTIVLSLSVELAMERLAERGTAAEHYEVPAALQGASEVYESAISTWEVSWYPMIVGVDARGTEEEIAERVWSAYQGL